MPHLQKIMDEIRDLSDEEYERRRAKIRQAAIDDLDFASALQQDAVRIAVLCLVKQLPAEQRDSLRILIDVMNNDLEATQTFAENSFDRVRAAAKKQEASKP